MLSQIITYLNILGSVVTAIALARTLRLYVITPRMGFYIFLAFGSMVLIFLVQLHELLEKHVPDWKTKLVSLGYWLKALYFAWAIRFQSLKKH